jgi:tetratricopeptide (TPR) repeat protein
MNIPGYTIKKLLGKGGMASVFLAVDEKFERMVAIKIMSPALSADGNFRERFLREAKIVARISHPNIVAVYDVNNVDKYYYIAMEYHPGGDLKRRIQKGLTVAEVLNITVSVAKALDYAHSKGYLHRDIKPDNILFRADGSAVLTDFGIAKATDNSTNTGFGLTQVGLVAGTPTYMSPEQARGKELGSASDLYALGIVLYEMLTGKPPYEANEAIALAIKHINEPIPKLEGKLKHFQPLLNGLLAKQPEQRFKSGSEVVEKIEALAAGYDFRGDVAAGRPEATKVFQRSLETISSTSFHEAARSRRKLGVVLLGIALLGLAGAGAWFGPKLLAPAARPIPVAVATVPAPVAVSAPLPAPVVAAVSVKPQLDAAAAAFARGDLLTPAGKSAVDAYHEALAIDPGNIAAQTGIQQVVAAVQARVLVALQKRDMSDAQRNIDALRKLEPDNPALPDLARAVTVAKAGGKPVMPVIQSRPAPAPVAAPAPAPAGGEVIASDAPTITVVPAKAEPDDGDDSAAQQQAAYNRMRLNASLALARRALSAGNFAQAVTRYQTVLDIDPDNAEAREGLRKAQAGAH